MTYNNYGWQHDQHGLAEAMRRVVEHRGCCGETKQDDGRDFDERMEDYWTRLHEGKTAVPTALCEVMATGVQMYMENSPHKGEMHCDEAELHHRYKQAIERIREEKDPNAKERMMKDMFHDLTPDEQVVLREKAKAKSYRDLAREKWGSNATAERWVDAMKNLKHKLTHSA